MTTGVVLSIAMLLLVVGEVVMLSLWVPAFCRHGIRVDRKSVALPGQTVPISMLEARCAGGFWSPRLAFRRLSDREVAFQEAASLTTVWSPIPVIRGLIIADPDGRRAEVVGILLWYPLVALAFLLVGMAPDGPWSMVSVTVGVAIGVFVMGAIQWARYSAVVTALREPRGT